jgi:Carboxypeptidase regulatory-like domain
MKKLVSIAALVAVAVVGLGAAVPAQAAAPASITGRAYSDKGTPIDGLTVSAGTKSATTDRTGKFVITGLKSGTYTLEFSDPTKHRYLTEYLGDSTTLSGADTITVASGEKHTGVSERLTHAALISGVVTVNGKKVDPDLGAVMVTLTNSAGTVIGTDKVTKSTFAFPGLPAGKYSLIGSEANSSYPHVTTESKTVTVVPGQQLNDQRLALGLVRGVVQNSAIATSVTHVGSTVKYTIAVKSYVSVKGGTVTLKYHRALHHVTTLGASGTATITVSTASWGRGDKAQLNVLFDGPMGVASSMKVTHFLVQ